MKKLFNHIKNLLQKDLLLLIIIIVAIFFQFYNFPYRYNLGDETVREAIIGLEGARTLQAPLIGGFSSAGPFTWGPWFYYQMIIASLLIPSSYAPWIYLSIMSLATIIILYKIGFELEDKKLGLILAALGAISPAHIISGTHLTFPNLLTIFSAFLIYLFIKIMKGNKNPLLGIVFGFILGIAINIHYQSLGLGILFILLFLYYFKEKVDYLYLLIVLFSFLFTFIPLLLFDLSNHWFNFKNITYYYLHGKDLIYVPNRWLFYLRDFWPAFWGDVIGINKYLGGILMVLSGLLLGYRFLTKKLSFPFIMIMVVFGSNFILLRYYWGERFFGYFVFLRPFVYLLTGYLFWTILIKLKKIKHGKFIMILIILAFFAIVGQNSLKMLRRDPFTLKMYDEVAKLYEFYPERKFKIFICSTGGNSYYAGVSKSLLLLLDMRGKLSNTGMKIGINGDTCIDPLLVKKAKKLKKKIIIKDMRGSIKGRKVINKSRFVNLSEFSEKELNKNKWSNLTFEKIYNTSVRWWFDEKP